MKYIKILGLLAVGAVALMAFAGTASATLTSPAGTSYEGEFGAASTNPKLHASVPISCSSSTFKGTSTSAGSTTLKISSLTFSGCGHETVTVISGGHLSIASSGATTSTGARVTFLTHTFFTSITIHCIFETNNTFVGTLTMGVAPAVWHFASAAIPVTPTDSGCEEAVEWTGSYSVSTPSSAITID